MHAPPDPGDRPTGRAVRRCARRLRPRARSAIAAHAPRSRSRRHDRSTCSRDPSGSRGRAPRHCACPGRYDLGLCGDTGCARARYPGRACRGGPAFARPDATLARRTQPRGDRPDCDAALPADRRCRGEPDRRTRGGERRHRRHRQHRDRRAADHARQAAGHAAAGRPRAGPAHLPPEGASAAASQRSATPC